MNNGSFVFDDLTFMPPCSEMPEFGPEHYVMYAKIVNLPELGLPPNRSVLRLTVFLPQ